METSLQVKKCCSLFTKLQPHHFAEQDSVRGGDFPVYDPAIIGGDGAGQQWRAGNHPLPGAKREALFARQLAEASESSSQVLMMSGKCVEGKAVAFKKGWLLSF